MKKQIRFGMWMLLAAMMIGLLSFACGSEDEDDSDGDVTADGDEDGDEDGDDTDGDDEQDSGVIGPKMEKMGLYNVVWLHGTPYEMGKQHGELLHDVIGEAVAFVLDDVIMSLIPGIAEEAGILEMANANSYQSILDECQGLVDATEDVGMTMDLCLILNFGDVMLEHIPFLKKSGDHGPGCTEVLANGSATPDGRLYHARNLDWGSMDISIIHQYPVIFVRQPEGGIPNLYVGFPLNLTPYTGMNAAGLSACSNEADPIDEEKKTEGRSHAQMLSVMLANSSTLEDAREFIMNEPHMSGETLVVADGNAQDGIIFELTANHQVARELGDGAIYAVNHYLDPQMVDYDLPQSLEEPDSSILRQERLEQLVDQGGADSLFGQLDLNGLATVMRDRVNPRTHEEAPWDEENIDNDAGIATNGPMHFVIFDPEKLLVWVAAGVLPIPAQPYQCFSLGELLNLPDAFPCDPETIPVVNGPETR